MKSIELTAVKHAALFGLSMNEPPEPGGFIADRQIIKFGSDGTYCTECPRAFTREHRIL